jgi:uncharacterized membrane protein YgcG
MKEATAADVIALLFVLLLILAIWLAVRLGGVRRREAPIDSARRTRRTDDTTIIGLPGDGSFIGRAGTDDDSGKASDSFQGGGGDFGGGGASGSWGDAGGDAGGGGDGGGSGD